MLFRRTNKYGYARYYSNGGPAYVIKIVVTVALLLALVIGGGMFAVKRYHAFVEKGGKLPWENWGVADDVSGGAAPETLGADTSEQAESSAPGDEADRQGFFARIGAFFAGSGGDSSTQPGQDGGSSSEDTSQSGEISPTEDAAQSGGAAVSVDEGSASEGTPEQAESSESEEEPEQRQGFFAWLLSLFKPKAADSGISAESSGSAGGDVSAEGGSSAGSDSSAGGDTSAESSAPAEEEETQPRAELTDGLRLQHLSIKDLTGGDAESLLKDAGANGVMLFIKESGGRLNYTSSEEIADELDACTDEDTGAAVAEELSALKDDGYYVLVYVDCFQDQLAGVKSKYSLYDDGGAPWYDDEARAWADPANEDIQSYLIGVVRELAELGCDEIVLNNACYPSTGTTGILSDECYDPSQFTSIVNSFYEKLAEETAGSGAVISLVSSAEAIQGKAAETTGQTLENMLQLGGRLWVECGESEAEELQSALEEAGYGEYTLGRVVDSLDGSGDGCQLVLD